MVALAKPLVALAAVSALAPHTLVEEGVGAGLDDLLVLRAHVLVLVGAGLIMGGEAEAGCSFAAMLLARYP